MPQVQALVAQIAHARLGRYITDAKKDSLTTAAERLASYVTDATHDGEKVA